MGRRRSAWLVCTMAGSLAFALAPALRPARAYDGSLYDTPTEWHDETGAKVALDAWRGQRVALSFFYSSCDRTCDRTFGWMQRLADEFAASSAAVELVLMTLDPEHDTVARLASYKQARELGGHWHLLTGDAQQVRRLTHELGFGARNMDGHILHDFRIYLLDDEGHVTDVVEWRTKIDEILERTAAPVVCPKP